MSKTTTAFEWMLETASEDVSYWSDEGFSVAENAALEALLALAED